MVRLARFFYILPILMETEVHSSFSKERYYRTPHSSILSIRPHFEDFHRLKTSGKGEYPLHQHQNYEIILVEKGPYRCSLNDEEIQVPEKRMIVIKPGDWHQDHFREGQQHFVIHFRLTSTLDVEAVNYSLFANNVSSEMQLSQAEFSKEIRFVIDELAREADEKLPYSANVQDSFLEVMFWRLLRGLPDSSLSTRFRQLNKDQSFIERFNRIIKDNLSQNLKMKDLAEMLQVSRRTLSTKCTLLTGAPPAQAYMQVKIDIAVSMLRHTDMAIKEVSFELGFRNQYHFSRVFKRHTGHSPSETRNGNSLSAKS